MTWSDGEPFTSEDVAYTYGRILDGGTRALDVGLVPQGRHRRGDARRHHGGADLRAGRAPRCRCCRSRSSPSTSGPTISEDEVKSFGNEPSDGQPVVGSGAFRLVEGTAGGSTYRFEANPDYWEGAPHIDEVVFRVYKSEDPAIQALIKGEVDFVEGITALQVQALQGRDGIEATNGDSPGFDEIAFNAGSIDTKTGEPIGDPNPAVLDPKFRFALNFAIDRDQIIDVAYQGAGQPGSTIIPPAYTGYRWEPPAEDAPDVRPGEGSAAAGRGRLHRR